MPPMVLRRLTAADREAAAAFLDARTMALRWLVAFLRHLDELPEEEEPYWSLWVGEAGGEIRCVVAHFFQTATTYLCAGADTDLRPLERLVREELLPERMACDLDLMSRWRCASPALFERAESFEEIDVLEGSEAPGGAGEPPGFRAAGRADLPILEEYGRQHAAEAGEEYTADYETLVGRGLVFVVEEEGRVKGLIRSNLSDGRYVHAGGVYVHPSCRGKGVGRALARGLAARVRAREGASVILDVNRGNERALRAYLAAGYRRVGGGLEARFAEGAWE